MKPWLILFGWLLAQPVLGSPLGDALERAWERNPQAQGLAARVHEMAARQSAARSLVPAPPSVAVSYRSDELNRDRGQKEIEAELGLPLWLPGEQSARQEVADTEAAALAAQLRATRLALAGEVREAFWAWHFARAEHDLLAERLETTRRLEEDVARRVHAGELARTDLLLAQSETLAARSALLEQEARQAQADRAWQLLTGLPRPPAPEEEPEGRTDDHPRLDAARTALAQAQARQRLTREALRDTPELALFTRRERGNGDELASNSIGVRLRIPLATEARNAPRQAAAEAEALQSERDLALWQQRLDAEAAQARLGDSLARSRLEMARIRQQVNAENLRLTRKAFDYGEQSLAALLRVQSLAFEADLALRQQTLNAGLARARLNQALGVLP